MANDISTPSSNSYFDTSINNLPDDITSEDVITDFTGLTKPVSAGAILSCVNGEWTLQYIPALYKTDKKDH